MINRQTDCRQKYGKIRRYGAEQGHDEHQHKRYYERGLKILYCTEKIF